MPKKLPHLEKEAQNRAKIKIRLYNPSTKDFSVYFHDGEKQKTLTIPALEIKKFPYNEARHLKKHLVDHLLNKKGVGYVTPTERRETEQQVEVKL